MYQLTVIVDSKLQLVDATTDSILQCDVCRKDYINKEYLRAHMIIVHGGMKIGISCFNVMYTLYGEWGMNICFCT